MPIYEYKCQACNQVMEAIQKFSDPPLEECPKCGGRVEKIMSLGSFQLKGQGWYVTDYKGKNASTAGESCASSSDSTTGSSSSDSSSSDSACSCASASTSSDS